MSHPDPRAGRRLADNPIALVGMGGLFPQAASARDYWQNVVDGVDCSSEIPADRWRIDDHYDADPAAPDKTYSRRGGFVPTVDFDPLEFGLPPNQLEVTSTLQTLSLGVARDALADAGAPGSDWYDPSRTGVVLGVTGPVPLMHPLAARLSTPVLEEVVRSCGLSADDGRRIAATYAEAFAPWVENSFPGLLANVVAGRIANRFGLGGMNSTVDAACAASLSAVRVAIAELVDGRADLMLTGGCDTENSIFIYLCFSKVGALSKGDRIRPFDASADGTLLGEGIGMIALKRLADAERDGDRVYAVIDGLGSSSDGRHKSIYAPRAEGQRLALDRAYDDARCSPTDVELFEAHATGTAVGDRTELTALGGLLTEHGAAPHSAAIGSVKSQIGHTKGAAGTASLMKLALGLHQKVLPPTIGVEAPADALAEPGSPLYPNTRTRPWVLDPERPRRRAAASAMGFGGTNFHVVLAEPASGRAGVRTLHRTATTVLWHAPDVAGLRAALAAGEPAPAVAPVPEGDARLGFAARDDDEVAELRDLALAELDAHADAEVWSHPRGIHFRRRAVADLRVGAVFAGQGSQYPDMGLEAVLNNPTVGAAFDEANAAFAGAATRLGTVVFPPPVFDADLRRDQELALRATHHAQPAIGALAAGQFRFLRDRGLDVAAVLGHSFGELTALWAAGSLSDTDFFALARARGLAMAPAEGSTTDPGAMAAVTASREQVVDLLDEAGLDDVVVCNHNAPDQVVVGGGTEQVQRFVDRCGERGISARALPVAAAFHTGHVAHAVEAFRSAVDRVEVGAPTVPVIANSPDAHYGDDVAANRGVLTGQLLQPVEFVRGLSDLVSAGCTAIVEFGPKQVLTQLVRRTLGDAVVAVPTDAGPLGDSDLALKQAAVHLAVLGAPMSDIGREDAPAAPRRVPAGMTVPLSGGEYVPPERTALYRAGLDDPRPLEALAAAPAAPHRENGTGTTAVPSAALVPAADGRSNGATAPPVAPAAPMVTTGSATPTPATAAAPAAPVAAPAGDDVLTQQTALHERYLGAQLDVAERLVAAWEGHGDDPATASIAEAVVAHTEAVSRAHVRAQEVLGSLAALGHGMPPTATAPSTPTPPAVAPAAPVTPEPARAPAARPAEPAPAPAPSAPAASVPTPPALPAGAGFDAAALRSVLVEVVADKTGYPASMVDPGLDLEADLGVDSIKRVQVLGAVQERYPQLPAIGPESLAELRTLDAIVEHLAPAAATTPAEPAAPPVPGGSDDAGPASGDGDDAVGMWPVEIVALPAREVGPGGAPYAADPVAVLVDRGGPEPDALAAELTADGWTVRRLTLTETVGADWLTAEPDDPSELDDRLDDLVADGTRVDACVVHLRDEEDLAGSLRQLADAVVVAGRVQPALARTAAGGTRAAFVTVSRCDGALGLRGHLLAADSVLAGAGGLVKTLARETPELYARALDLAAFFSPTDAAAEIVAELGDVALDVTEVGIDRDRDRWTTAVSGTAEAPDAEGGPAVGADDVVVVTGGARGVTARCALELAARSRARFVLLGRTSLGDEPAWAQDVADADLTAAAATALAADTAAPPTPRAVTAARDAVVGQREVRRTLEQVRAQGARVDYVPVDVTDPDAVREALADVAHVATVVVHGAGALADATLSSKTRAQVHRVLAPKLAGLAHVLGALSDAPLHSVVLFGSVAGVYGNPGQGDYAVANEALARWAASLRRGRPERRVVTLAWGAWDGGMVTPELREHFRAQGVPLIDLDAGAAAFADRLGADRGSGWSVVGAAEPLGGPSPRPAGAVSATRDLDALRTETVLDAHRVGDEVVLPAVVAAGWMIGTAERTHPGRTVVEVRDLAVQRGVVFGDDPVGALTLTLDETHDGAIAAAIGSGGPAARYTATLRLDDGGAAAPVHRHDWPLDGVGRGEEDGAELYRRGLQFHGPALQGMRRVLEDTDDRLVVECRLPRTPLARGAYAGRRHDPVLADVVLQVPPVLGARRLGSVCLPIGVGRIELLAALPADTPFVVVVDRPRPGPMTLRCDATVCAPDGRVIQRWSDVDVVTTPDLDERFARSAARHAGTATVTGVAR